MKKWLIGSFIAFAAYCGNEGYIDEISRLRNSAQSVGPVIVSATASDPDNGDAVFSNGDTLTLVFDQNTNQPAVTNQSQINSLFSFNQNMGLYYWGNWLSPSTLVFTFSDVTGAGPPDIATLELSHQKGSTLKNAAETSATSSGTSPTISGNWGTFCVPTTVTTFSGSGTNGYLEGEANTTQFGNLDAIARGNSYTYVYDNGNDRMRRIDSEGSTSFFVGSGSAGYTDGTGAAASFRFISDLVVDSSGNIFAADSQDHRIRRISPSGVVTTFAGDGTSGNNEGTGTSAQFNFPFGLAIDASDNLYVADSLNNRIRKITPAGVTSTLAGSSSEKSHPLGSLQPWQAHHLATRKAPAQVPALIPPLELPLIVRAMSM